MKEALKLALEALESGVSTQIGRVAWTEYDSWLINEAITAIKEALAPTSTQCEVQPEQEPFGHWHWEQPMTKPLQGWFVKGPSDGKLNGVAGIALYTTPLLPEQEPVARVAEVHMSRYTLEWTNGPLPEGTELFAAAQPLLPVQEPWMYRLWNDKDAQWQLTDDCSWPAEPIYTTPPKRQPLTCAWSQEDDDTMPGTYRSACGELWSFIDGGWQENKVRYCHGCGGKVVDAHTPAVEAAHGIKENT